ncbi:hypothetical protein GTA08_BOTSDO02024 [Neofusicoccum parvum]|uniref:Uncharacterized protein n=1 Tax=Neofusicoccum parvum TaxID=310453 RepID=A0ACB5SPN2_9PEZI|nr:hypothetical protein GTA08_BOTSDO02024 [Neofusicoccum parvum]
MGDVQMEDVQMQGQIDGAIERAKASDIGTPVDAAYIEKGVSSKQVRFAREKESATTSRRHTTDRSAVLSPKFSSEHLPKADSEESDPESESAAEVYNPLRTRSGRAPGRISGLEAKQVIADQVVPSRLGARNSKKEDKEYHLPGRQTQELDTYLETIKLPKSWYESQKKVDRKPRHSALGLLDGDLRPVLRDDVHPISQNDLPRNLRWNDPRNNGGPRNASKTAKKVKGNALDEILDEAEYKFKSRAPPTPPSEPYPESRATYKFLNAKDEQLVSPSSLDRKKSNVHAKAPSSVRASSANVPGQASSSGLSSTHNPPGANEAKLQRNLSNLYSGFENDKEEMQDDTIDAFYRPNHSAPPKRRRVDGRYSEERESEAAPVPDALSTQPPSSQHGSTKRKIKGKDWWTSMLDATEARGRPAVEASQNASGFPTIPRATRPAKSSSRPRRAAQRAGGRFGAPTVPGANTGTAPGDRQRAFAAPPRRPVYTAPHVTFQPAQGVANHPPGIRHEAHPHQHSPGQTHAFQGSNNHPRPASGTMNAPQLPPQNHPGYAPFGYAPPAGAQQAQGFANYPLPHGAGMAPASQVRSHTEPPEFAPGFAHGSANGWPGNWN